jgi:hypothetical protein
MLAADEDVTQIIIEVCVQHGVTPEELLTEIAQAEGGTLTHSRSVVVKHEAALRTSIP